MQDSHTESTGKVGTTEGLQRQGTTKSKNCACQNAKNHQNRGRVAEVGLGAGAAKGEMRARRWGAGRAMAFVLPLLAAVLDPPNRSRGRSPRRRTGAGRRYGTSFSSPKVMAAFATTMASATW